jgi:hypothetical protein
MQGPSQEEEKMILHKKQLRIALFLVHLLPLDQHKCIFHLGELKSILKCFISKT